MNSNADRVGGMDKGKSVPSGSSDDCGVSEMVRVLPRVGADYQVDIPPYIETRPDGANSWDLSVGLHIPLRWANQEGTTTKKLNGSSSIASSSRGRRRSSKIILGGGKSTDVSIAENQPKGGSLSSYLVPEDVIDLWTDIEKTSFILSLYIFEKDFVQVTRFLQTKNTGDIMAYYYGEFYASNEYYRWSRTRKDRDRKVRARKCVYYGEMIFSGSRLEEILSRLLSIMSTDSHSELLEISRKYVEKRICFEEYIFTLKSMVGLSSLIEAVVIGKGQQDLTNYSLEFTRSNRAFRLCPEIPIGKACASLTPAEIIKCLTEGYRLSKARSNDLFWEAVWPLLLARGWHSEQPNTHLGWRSGGSSSRQNLVFLMPGVEKFSRRLVKGTHYFDSISDVLAKVAAEPQWLELNQEENVENNSNDPPMRRRNSYLRPPSPTNQDLTFTVVDTSLCNGKPFKVRDLGSLPLEISRGETSSGKKNLDIGFTNQKTPDVIDLESLQVSNAVNIENICEDMKSKSVAERDEAVDNVAPFTKRRRRSPRSRGETSNTSGISRVESVMHSSSHVLPQTDSFQDKMSPTSSSRSSHSVSTEHVPVHNSCVAQVSPAQAQPRMLIDLNVLPVLPEPETVHQSIIKATEEGADRGKKPESRREVQEANNMSSRRHGTRNRPPTTRALEAFASGFLTVNRRQRSREASSSRQSLGSSSSPQAHVGTRVSRFGSESEGRNGGTSSGPST